MWAFLTFFAAYWQWIFLGIITCVALAWLGFFLKNWKAFLACAVVVAAFFVVQAIDGAAYNRRVAEEIKARTTILQDRINELEALSREDSARAEQDSATIETLRKELDTPRNDKPALPRDAVDRIRKVQ